jgi:hypothetical protein
MAVLTTIKTVPFSEIQPDLDNSVKSLMVAVISLFDPVDS